MIRIYTCCSIIFMALLLIACNSQQQQETTNLSAISSTTNFTEDDAAEYDMNALYSAVRKRGELLLVYATQSEASHLTYQSIAQEIRKSYKRINVIVRSDEEVTSDELKSYPLYLIGSVNSNKIIKAVSNKTPFEATSDGFQFDHQLYPKSSDNFILGVYPSPYNPQLPISIISGNQDDSLIKLMNQLFQNNWRRLLWNAWGYQIFRDGKRAILGQFSREKERRWEIDKRIHWDFKKQASTHKKTEHFKLITHGQFEEQDINELLPTCENTLKQIEAFTQKTASFKINYHIYATLEEKGLLINNTEQANVDFRKLEVHTVINEEFANNFIQKENELVLRNLLGKPQRIALEQGLAIHFTSRWQREGYRYWAKKLFDAQNLVPLSELLDNELFEKESQLVFGAMSGVLVDFLMEQWGKEKFLKHYQSWNPSQKEIHKLEKLWVNYFQKTVVPEHKNAPTYQPNIPSYFKGFNFAHEGYNIYNGYISQLACTSLDSLIAIGSNAVAIVPYSYMGNPNKPSYLEFSRWAGSETDESVIHSSFQAKKRGMHSLLKPQIWLGRSWPGDVDMQSDEDWKKFFRYYNRWMRHYALLAEIHEIDMLCLGVEFAQATVQRPDDWMNMAHQLRKIYSGPITYAANWGEEAENTKIWPAFDFIGINCYYPLSKKANPSDKELRQTFKETMEMLERKFRSYEKPVVFTEIGFRSIDEVWKQPHAEPTDKSFNQVNQARCYEAVFSNLPANQKWCKGMFWWKWPSYMNYAEKRKQSFAPTKKQAEAVVKKWFQKL